MTDQEWTNKLRRRLNRYERLAPEGLWDNIERSLDRHRRKRNRIRIMATISGAAAAVMALLLIWPHTTDTPYSPPAPGENWQATNHIHNRPTSPTYKESRRTARLTPQATSNISPRVTISRTQEEDGSAQIHGTPAKRYPQTESTTLQKPGDHAQTPDTTHGHTPAPTRHSPSQNRLPISNDAPYGGARNKSSRFSMRLMASGAGSSKNRHDGYGSLTGRPFPSESEPPATVGVLDALIQANAHQDLPTHTETRHRLPIRTSLMLGYAITPRFNIETGMAYTLLRSYLRSGSSHYFFNTDQALHFLGIPAGMRVNVWRTHRFEAYSSAGGMIEICVGGHAETEYVMDGQKASVSRHSVRMKAPQWSLYASAGIQVNINRHWGVFVEPGVSYHFDNGSRIETYYNDHPLNFKLNLGARFTLPERDR